VIQFWILDFGFWIGGLHYWQTANCFMSGNEAVWLNSLGQTRCVV